MKIKANMLKPKLTMDEIDIYLPRGVKALKDNGHNPIGLFRIFQRHEGAYFFGLHEYLGALASLIRPEIAKEISIYTVPEGHRLSRHETAITLVGPAQSLMVNETLLHYLSTGTRFRTLAEEYPGDKYPWVFMGARYLAGEDLAIATRALSEKGILSTTPKWADKYIGTMSHSQIAMWGGLALDEEAEVAIARVTHEESVAATIRATIAFARANPKVPLYVLGDFATRSVGCFETFLATHKVCQELGFELIGGRMDISKADLFDWDIIDNALADSVQFSTEYCPSMLKNLRGINPEVVKVTRSLLDSAGLKEFKLVVSSGISLKDIDKYVEAGANIVGIGEEAAYFLNKGETNFTSDAVGYFNGEELIPFAKEGRGLDYIFDEDGWEEVKNSGHKIRISENLSLTNLTDYL